MAIYCRTACDYQNVARAREASGGSPCCASDFSIASSANLDRSPWTETVSVSEN